MNRHHKQKYANVIKMCREAKDGNVEVIVVAHPKVLGDNYEELVTNLGLLAEHGLALRIVGKEL